MSSSAHLSARQIKAARALLDWSQDDLAAAAKLSVATIRNLELGNISPRFTTTEHIRRALEDAGLEFLDPNGVRQRPEEIRIYEGSEGLKDFYDDVYNNAKAKGGDVVSTCPDANVFFDMLGDFQNIHFERMAAIKSTVSVKCIVTENRVNIPGSSAYCEFRSISKHYVDSVPFYVYGDKYAVRLLKANPAPKIIVFQSREMADAFRQQFYSMWEKATPLNATPVESTLLRRKAS